MLPPESPAPLSPLSPECECELPNGAEPQGNHALDVSVLPDPPVCQNTQLTNARRQSRTHATKTNGRNILRKWEGASKSIYAKEAAPTNATTNVNMYPNTNVRSNV